MNAQEVLHSALRLPPEERAYVADRIQESLDSECSEAELKSELAAEIQRRAEQVDRGEVALAPMEDAIAEARKQLVQLRIERRDPHLLMP